MTRIKKGILTLVSLSLVLIYCLINDPSRDITLTLGLYAGSSWDVPNGESYQVIDQAIKKFEKKYPNVHIEYKSGIIKDDYSSWLMKLPKEQYLMCLWYFLMILIRYLLLVF